MKNEEILAMKTKQNEGIIATNMMKEIEAVKLKGILAMKTKKLKGIIALNLIKETVLVR